MHLLLLVMVPFCRGLYDLAMGPLEQAHLCRTCNMGFASCPGHLGHVELDFPVRRMICFSTLVCSTVQF